MTKTDASQWETPALVARNAVRALGVLAGGALRRPGTNIGTRWHFTDGSTATIYRETAVARAPATEPVVLVVRFQARSADSEPAHRRYERRSAVILPVIIGQPGFISKLWFSHDDGGWYRGLYEFDGAGRADQYVGLLARLLARLTVPGSMEHRLLGDSTRASLVRGGQHPSDAPAWWCPRTEQTRAAHA